MPGTEVVESTSLAKRAEDYRTVRRFIDVPPPGMDPIYTPLQMLNPTHTRDILIMAVATQLTMRDFASWDPENRTDARTRDDGVILRLRPAEPVHDQSGINVVFYDLLNPTSRRIPMLGLSLLPSGEVDGSGRGQHGYIRGAAEQDEETVGAVFGLVARTIRDNHLLSLQQYWIQQIEGINFLPSESPFPPR